MTAAKPCGRAGRFRVCPRCEAEQAIGRMRELEACPPSPDVNWYAHATGISEGALENLLLYRLRLCAKHREPR